MDALGIVHMKGRIYDPTLGRFLQADPFVQAPKNSQNYNRYSYVLNNPMSYTDPSGYFFKAIFEKISEVPILNAVITVLFAVYCQACLVAYNTISSYVLTGSVKAAFISGVATAMMPGGGNVGGVFASALVGGVSSRLQGGNLGHGFWSAGIGASLGGNINGIKSTFGRVVASTVVGGTISKITGGKFANGAMTAAFAQAMASSISGESFSEKTTVNSKQTVKVDTSQIENKNDQKFVMDHLDSLEGDSDIHSGSLITARLDVLNVSFAAEFTKQDILMGHMNGQYLFSQQTTAYYMYQTAKYGTLAFGFGVFATASDLELTGMAGYELYNGDLSTKSAVGIVGSTHNAIIDGMSNHHPIIKALNLTVSETLNRLPWVQ